MTINTSIKNEIQNSRRHFLKLSASTMALASMPSAFALTAKMQPKSANIGLQLYTLRDMMAVSVSATLKLVAAVGYSDLEFAGYFGHQPSEIKTILKNEGLSAPSAHIPLTAFDTSVNAVIDHALEVGHKYIVIPYLTEEQRGTSIDVYKKLAQQCNSIGEACNKAGLKLAYHHHEFEFEIRDGEVPFDILLNEVDKDLMDMEMDLYWMAKAQQDPLAYFKQYPGRFTLWHVKDMDKKGNFTDVGTGVIDFEPIFAQAKLSGVKHKFVERDHTDDKLKTIQQGYKAVSKLLA